MFFGPMLRCGVSVLVFIGLARPGPAWAEPSLNDHPVVLDGTGSLSSWVSPQSQAYDRVVRLAWDFLSHRVPTTSVGLTAYFTYSYLDRNTLEPAAWPHNPAGLYAMLGQSLLGYYAYSGDQAAIAVAKDVVDYQLAHGLTPSGWAWGGVPFASSDPGATEYAGAHFGDDSGRGDGFGVIEPDKIGELGVTVLNMYELSGDTRYRDAAIAWADTLSRHVRQGDAQQSPWPFRVVAQTDEAHESYTAHVIAPVRLFDELIRIRAGDTVRYRAARQQAWDWLMAYPMKNDLWSNYFEDVPSSSDANNVNQLVALDTARYLLEHPDTDPNWVSDTSHIVAWVENTFGRDEFGAKSIGEQAIFNHPMGSHTARYAAVNALLYERTGDVAAREKALRSFNWASYMASADGRVIDGPEVGQIWFSDGYGDYIRHFLAGMAAVPEWAPPGQDHLLRSSSIVKSIAYRPGEVRYETFDADAQDVLRLSFVPDSVTANGQALSQVADSSQPGWEFDTAQGLLRVGRAGAAKVVVTGTTPLPPAAAPRIAPVNPASPPDVAVTVTFDDQPEQDKPLDGQYPGGVIDWGSGMWYVSGPWQQLTTRSVSFNGLGLSRATLQLLTTRRLSQVDAYNGGADATTVTVGCTGQALKEVSLQPGQMTTIATDQAGPCASVTIASSNGWDTNFDNFVLR